MTLKQSGGLPAGATFQGLNICEKHGAYWCGPFVFVLNSSWDNVISKFGKRLFRQELQLLAKELQFLEIEILAQAAIGNETNEALIQATRPQLKASSSALGSSRTKDLVNNFTESKLRELKSSPSSNYQEIMQHLGGGMWSLRVGGKL